MNELKATYWGYLAVVMWGLLALFTVLSAPIPPFQLTALSFGIGGILGLIWVVATGGFRSLFKIKSIGKFMPSERSDCLAITSSIFQLYVMHLQLKQV